MNLNFDPTIDLGTIIATIVFVGGILKLSGRMAVIEFKVNELWNRNNGRVGNDPSSHSH